MTNVNQRNSQWKLILGLFVIVLAFLRPTVVLGEETLNFHVTPELPQSQIEGTASYYNLNLNPGETETLVLLLQNDKEEPIEVKVTAHTAFTNVNGVVEYGKTAEQADPTLLYSIDELIEPIDTIELAAKESKRVELTLKMPADSFEGVLAGGLRIEEVRPEEENVDNGESIAIKNEFSYVVGVLARTSQTTVQPDLELLDVFADQANYRNVISATLQNFTPTFVNRLEVEATVQREGEDEVLYEISQSQMQMAPNSNFNFPISLEGDRFQSGDYVLNMTARSGEEEWEWTKKFTIEADEARKLNRADVTIDTSTNWWMMSAIGLFVIVLGIVIYVLLKKRKQKKANSKIGKE
ncbi:DUF916 and DUF3324 domain-containing protein [Carnobacterium maltaromaticum]|uniref:DUF916 and DUF3324 domain-containing protein n=1 Tax=Carnobacterium maltaromaticum TaxID=2751 RepID=UPI0039BDCE62